MQELCLLRRRFGPRYRQYLATVLLPGGMAMILASTRSNGAPSGN